MGKTSSIAYIKHPLHSRPAFLGCDLKRIFIAGLVRTKNTGWASMTCVAEYTSCKSSACAYRGCVPPRALKCWYPIYLLDYKSYHSRIPTVISRYVYQRLLTSQFRNPLTSLPVDTRSDLRSLPFLFRPCCSFLLQGQTGRFRTRALEDLIELLKGQAFGLHDEEVNRHDAYKVPCGKYEVGLD